MKVRLGDIAVLINGDRGKNYPSQADIMEDGDIPFVNAGHLTGREVSFEDMNYISKEKYDSLNAGKFCKGDILYCLRGSLGKKALVEEEIVGAIASSLVIIRTNEQNVDRNYLMFALDSPSIKEQLMKANNGSSQPNLSAASVKQYEIDLPDLHNQINIVERLIKVRNVIDIRKQELEKLDELIKARFVELFVGKDYPLVALDDLSLGKGEYGAQSASIEYNPSRPRYVRITDIQDDGTLNDDVVSSANIEDDEQYKLSYGDFMFARMGATVGKTYAYKSGNQIFAGYLIRYRLNLKKIIPEYLYAYTRLEEYKNWVLLNQSGAAQPGINAKKYGSLLIPVAPLEEQRAFEDFVTQVDKSKVAVQKSLDEAQLLFDCLMQKYFG